MPEAYRCDGCQEFFEGSPALLIEAGFLYPRTLSESGKWTVCGWLCLGRLGVEKGRRG